jgi:hypothetical protein
MENKMEINTDRAIGIVCGVMMCALVVITIFEKINGTILIGAGS